MIRIPVSGLCALTLMCLTAPLAAHGQAGSDTQAATAAPTPSTAVANPVPALMPEIRVEVVRRGRGRLPHAEDHVLITYTGRLEDGTQFDAASNVPFSTSPDSPLIPGFLQGLQQVQAGGKYRFHIPAALGYGARAVGPIPANSNLVFEVEVAQILNRIQMRDSLPRLFDGLRVETLSAGAGPFVGPDQFVVLSYVGTLENGTQFDAASDIPFPAGLGSGLIPGFARALDFVQAGGHYRLHIPAVQAYGAAGAGPIPANANLLFDIRVSRFVTQAEAMQLMAAQQTQATRENTP